MTKEDYSTIMNSCKNVYLPKDWYVVFPDSSKLKNFDSFSCRTVFFVVTDVSIREKNYYSTFKCIEDLHLIYDRISHLDFFKKNISLIDYQMSISHNRYLSTKCHSFTVHFVDKVSNAVLTLNEK